METVFLKLLNMSITASWIVLAVIVLRLLLKKAPKWIRGVLWALVAVRLLCPFSFESMLSLIPSGEPIPKDILVSEAPAINSGVPLLNQVVNPVLSQRFAPVTEESANPMQTVTFIASAVWAVGVLAMLIYTLVSYLRIHRKVREAVRLKDNIWMCDRIATPFIFGLFRPRIYLPSFLREEDMEYVISHERAHLKRRDHIWKPLGFLILSVYWFNPILWLAYIMLCKDIELACDEKVIRTLGTGSKKPYSDALIHCSVPRKMIAACPLAFGEVSVKERVRSVLNYRRPAFWIILVAILACIATAVCLLTNPKKEEKSRLFKGAVVTDIGTNYNGVSWSVESVDDNFEFTMMWVNSRYETITLENNFSLIHLPDMSYCQVKEGVAFEANGWIVNGEGIQTIVYQLTDYYDMDVNGAYRLVVDFTVEGDENTYTAHVDFVIGEDASVTGTQYEATSWIYDCGMYSATPLSVGGNYMITEDKEFMEAVASDSGRILRDLGPLTLFKLAEDNFDILLEQSPIWAEGYTASAIREDNERAYRVSLSGKSSSYSGLNEVFYYILYQDNGDVYLAEGYRANFMSSSTKNGAHIRWMYRLEQTDSADIETQCRFDAKVLEVKEDTLLVKRDDESQTFVPRKTVSGTYVTGIREGERVRIIYDGEELFMYPGQILAVYDISVIDDTDEPEHIVVKVKTWFDAKVLEVNRKSVLVQPIENAEERKVADQIWVSLDTALGIIPELKEGDTVQVGYDGKVTESYPAQIHEVYAIYNSNEFDGDCVAGGCMSGPFYSYNNGTSGGIFSLHNHNKTFEFSWSAPEHYCVQGTYELTDTALILKTGPEGKTVYTYVFDVIAENTFAFDESKSSPLPRYIYAVGGEPQSPIPDGAVFTLHS